MFLGIDLPEEIKNQINILQKEIESIEVDAKFVEKENLHINLKFFGDKNTEEKKNITNQIEKVSKNFNGFNLGLKSIGVFPNENYIKVVWIGIESGKEELSNLQNQLEKSFQDIDIEKEEREFVPHVTLCRIHSPKNKERIVEKINEKKEETFGNFFVDKIILIKSELSSEGPKYTKENIFELRK